VSHNATALALFKEGEKASFGLQRMAEKGSAGALLSGAVTPALGDAYGDHEEVCGIHAAAA